MPVFSTPRRVGRVTPIAFSSFLSIMCVGFCVVLPPSASAEVTLSAGAGVFEPWEGDTGYEVDAAVFGSVGASGRWRLGGEFSFRQFDAEFFGVHGIEVESYRLSFVAHRRFLAIPVVQPYIGGRVSVSVNSIDADAVEDAKPFVDADSVGTGAGLAGILGVDVPIGEHFAVYWEVSLGIDIQLTDDGSYDVENIGGASGIGGVRVRF